MRIRITVSIVLFVLSASYLLTKDLVMFWVDGNQSKFVRLSPTDFSLKGREEINLGGPGKHYVVLSVYENKESEKIYFDTDVIDPKNVYQISVRRIVGSNPVKVIKLYSRLNLFTFLLGRFIFLVVGCGLILAVLGWLTRQRRGRASAEGQAL